MEWPATQPAHEAASEHVDDAPGVRRLTVVALCIVVALSLVVLSAGATYYAVINGWLEPITGTVYTANEHREGLEAAYDQGQAAGHAAGHTVGYEAGEDSGFAAGESAGEEAGYERGYGDGEATGYAQGETAGYAAGEKAGLRQGHARGYEEGFEDGETAGWMAGHDIGFAAGVDEGWSAGCDAIFDELDTDRVMDYWDYFYRTTGYYISRSNC